MLCFFFVHRVYSKPLVSNELEFFPRIEDEVDFADPGSHVEFGSGFSVRWAFVQKMLYRIWLVARQAAGGVRVALPVGKILKECRFGTEPGVRRCLVAVVEEVL